MEKDNCLDIKDFLGMSTWSFTATAPKDILSLMGRTSNTTINLRMSNVCFSDLIQNYSIDLSDIIFMYISYHVVSKLKVRRSSLLICTPLHMFI